MTATFGPFTGVIDMQAEPDSFPCPACGSIKVTMQVVPEKFRFGLSENAATLTAQVLTYTCEECSTQWSGNEGEDARAEAVERHMIGVYPQMLEALVLQHHALDQLFATLISLTMNHEKPFYPSESGAPWVALLVGKKAIEDAGGNL